MNDIPKFYIKKNTHFKIYILCFSENLNFYILFEMGGTIIVEKVFDVHDDIVEKERTNKQTAQPCP